MVKRLATYSLALIVVSSLVLGAASCGFGGGDRLRVATTTSLYDTGIWDYLEPVFEEEYSIEIDILYAGTGIAMEYGQRGDVDVITVHSRSRELQFIAEGYGVERVPFAYNYFFIVGPHNDPAGIAGMAPEDALRKLAESKLGYFVSRGDDSGTHSKEKALWQAAGYDYGTVQQMGDRYIEAGRGMGPTLLMASEIQAYTLSDMGTFLSYRGQIDLEPMINEGSALLNVYSVIACNPEANPNINYKMAENLVDFLISPKIQELIGEYGVSQYGMSLFSPWSDSIAES
jgi:tungstate transport system substrate-binding protein